ncbi:MAG: N-acetylmuramoyl-L-alanine amidase [Planctomicrobium sp.]|jgi:hypothetical protein|nr:N-acetylmuramoyl-L-alanine amidase [Planctomicrobium sp.]
MPVGLRLDLIQTTEVDIPHRDGIQPWDTMNISRPILLPTICTVLTVLHLLSVCGCAESKSPRSKDEFVTQAAHIGSPGSDLKGSVLDTPELLRPWKYIVLHHSATESGSLESIHATHSQRRDSAGNPWRGIGYHFVIGNGNGMPDGQVRSTFRWKQQTSGAHAGNRLYNNYGVGICLIGNFEQNGPTSAQMKSVRELVSQLKFQFGITKEQILKHGDLKATACPGRLFPFQEIAASPPAGLQELASKQRSRFSSGEPGHMEGIKNVVSIQRSRSAQRNRATRSANDRVSE